MKHAWMTLAVGLILALGAGQIEAQQAPPAKKAPTKKRLRKAKKVWTNDDFPERPARKAEKAEKKTKPVTEEEEEAKLKEALEELDAQAARAQSAVDWQQSRREELLAGKSAPWKRSAMRPPPSESNWSSTRRSRKSGRNC